MTHRIALAERNRIAAWLEIRAAKVRRHGGTASARQLAIAADDVRAGLHLETRDG